MFGNSTKLLFKEAWANRYDSAPYSEGVPPIIEDSDLKVRVRGACLHARQLFASPHRAVHARVCVARARARVCV